MKKIFNKILKKYIINQKICKMKNKNINKQFKIKIFRLILYNNKNKY